MIVELKLNKDQIEEYLAYAIKRWRKRKTEASEALNCVTWLEDGTQVSQETCECYVDAYQSVYSSIFGETLK